MGNVVQSMECRAIIDNYLYINTHLICSTVGRTRQKTIVLKVPGPDESQEDQDSGSEGSDSMSNSGQSGQNVNNVTLITLNSEGQRKLQGFFTSQLPHININAGTRPILSFCISLILTLIRYLKE